MLLKGQYKVSAKTPMPTRDMLISTKIIDVSGGAAQLVVASTNANDVGSAAGTVVFIRLTNSGILDSAKMEIGNKADTSFSFVTGTILTTMVEWPWIVWEENEGATRAVKMAAVGALLSNGQYCLDHRTGLIIGKKATTGTSDTANFSYRIAATS